MSTTTSQRNAANNGVEMKSKIAAAVLAITIGCFGAHNFYLGFTGKAIAQLLITILSFGLLFWVSTIWSLVEGILIITAEPGSKWSFDARGRPLGWLHS